jgi:hypothetical protein
MSWQREEEIAESFSIKENFMFRSHFFMLFVLSLLVMGEAVTTRAADSAAPAYPDWAAAVVPAYPHALPSSGPITPNLYGIATTDHMPTVVAWYKSRVHGAWSESEGGNTWSLKSGGVLFCRRNGKAVLGRAINALTARRRDNRINFD